MFEERGPSLLLADLPIVVQRGRFHPRMHCGKTVSAKSCVTLGSKTISEGECFLTHLLSNINMIFEMAFGHFMLLD